MSSVAKYAKGAFLIDSIPNKDDATKFQNACSRPNKLLINLGTSDDDHQLLNPDFSFGKIRQDLYR